MIKDRLLKDVLAKTLVRSLRAVWHAGFQKGTVVLGSVAALWGGVMTLGSRPSLGAETCQCVPQSPEFSLVKGSSPVNGPFELLFDQKVGARGVYQGSLCTSPSQEVAQIKLWMPDMGHGSSPTALEVVNDRCIRVTKINFMMAGLWEIRLVYKDGSMAQTSLEVP